MLSWKMLAKLHDVYHKSIVQMIWTNICDPALEKDHIGGIELLVMRFQNFPNFAKKFTQFSGYGVCWGENYGGGTKFSKQKFVLGKKFFCEISLFFVNIFGGHFYITQFLYPYKFHLH